MIKRHDSVKPVVLTFHARQRMKDRGAREEDVIEAIRTGEREQTRSGRVMFRLNKECKREWDGVYYRIQQVAPVVVEENERTVLITVYVFYF
jgi:ribosome recycling factor